MKKSLFFIVLGLGCGVISTIYLLKYYSSLPHHFLSSLGIQKPIITGFLPYWLINEKDYSPYIDTISYFGLTIDADGSILKRTKPTESEPGWLALQSGKVGTILEDAKKKNLQRSLVIFSGNHELINQLIEDPIVHAQNLVHAIVPILSQFDFNGLNIDIEDVNPASMSAQQNFTLFIQTIHYELQKSNSPISLSIDVSPSALIKPYFTDIVSLSPYVDKIIFMTYDFHFQGSYVTGAVSPVNGADVSAELDAESFIKEALNILPAEKIVLGVPLYGYEWETLSDYPHAAVIPGTGIVASNKRVEDFIAKCATCSAQFDPVSKESYLIYKDEVTNTFHQFFYPDKQAMQEKINLMQKYSLGGIALWALGYEGNTILEPLKELK